MENGDATRDTAGHDSSPSDPSSRDVGVPYGFPALVAVILGVTVSCILAGGEFCTIGLFIGMPAFFATCWIYTMYIMPRIAGLVRPFPKLDPKKRAHHQFRSAIRGLIFGLLAYAFITLGMWLFPIDAQSTPDQGPGEPLHVVLLAGPIVAVLAFFFVRYNQLRGIESWQRLYGIGDTDENPPTDDPVSTMNKNN